MATITPDPTRTQIGKTPVTITTDSDGVASALSARIMGRLEKIVLIQDEDDPLSNSGTVILTNEATGETIVSSTVANYIPSGSLTLDPVVLSGEKISIAVTNGGDTKTGTLLVYWS